MSTNVRDRVASAAASVAVVLLLTSTLVGGCLPLADHVDGGTQMVEMPEGIYRLGGGTGTIMRAV